MSEHVNNQQLFGPGGHAWQWAIAPAREKVIESLGSDGAVRLHMGKGPMAGRIVGTLRATGSTRAEASAAVDALVAGIQALIDAGGDYPAEDDLGHVLPSLSLRAIDLPPTGRAGQRAFAREGETWICLQGFTLSVVELSGGWA